MPDMIVQHVEGLLVERIKAQARHRQCSVNDVLLAALRQGLGMFAARPCSENQRDPHSLQLRDTDCEAAERGAFQEALQALADTPPARLMAEDRRYGEPDPDAQ